MEPIRVSFYLTIYLIAGAGVSELKLLLLYSLEMTTGSLFLCLTVSVHSLVPSATAALK